MIKQIKIYDKENNGIHGGIILDTGNVICACCGRLIEKDNIGPENNKSYSIMNIFETWVDFSDSILN